MPIVRYVTWVGTSLLALLFIVSWCLPDASPEPPRDPIERPVIRIASIQKPPELVVIDTSLPTIVPPPPVEPVALSEPAPSEPIRSEPTRDEPRSARASASAPPFRTAIDIDRKAGKPNKRHVPKATRIAAVRAPLAPAPAPANAGPATPSPRIRLSLADIVSGQLVRDLFNLR